MTYTRGIGINYIKNKSEKSLCISRHYFSPFSRISWSNYSSLDVMNAMSNPLVLFFSFKVFHTANDPLSVVKYIVYILIWKKSGHPIEILNNRKGILGCTGIKDGWISLRSGDWSIALRKQSVIETSRCHFSSQIQFWGDIIWVHINKLSSTRIRQSTLFDYFFIYQRKFG